METLSVAVFRALKLAMISDPSDKSASIHLDYGADSAEFDFEDLFICQRGLQIKTRWSFAPGTELSVNFQVSDQDSPCGTRLIRTQGVVADCECQGPAAYVATVVFLEVTDDILAAVKDLAASSQNISLAS